MKRLFQILDSEGSVRALALLRIFVGPVVVLHLFPYLEEMAEGSYYGDHFYVPYWSWFPEAPREVYYGMLIACVIAASLMSLGIFTRAMTITTFVLVAYNFFLSTTHFRHNRNFLLIVLAGLCLVPVGRAFSLDAWRLRKRGAALADRAPLWPLWLLRCEVSLVYLASGVSKLVDVDWWSGVVLWDRVLRYRRFIDESPAPTWLIELVTDFRFHQVFAKVAIFTEIFLGIALWSKRTRYAAVWVAIMFHATIEMSARVQVFSWLAIAATLIWVVPSTRDRTLIVRTDERSGRWLAWCVRRFDWLARFVLTERSDDPRTPVVVLTDRDGTTYEGPRAARIALSRLPMFAFPLLPTLLPGVARVVDWLMHVCGKRRTDLEGTERGVSST